MFNWKEIVVGPNDSIRTTMLKIDAGALRFAIVTDESGHLLGTVTDGDIRRSLIAGKTLQEDIDGTYNPSPYWVCSQTNVAEIKAYLLKNSLLAVPLVDNNVVVGLHTLQSLSVSNRKSNPVFIMAGGFGTRLKPLTDTCPKPMLNIGGKPMLERLIEQFKDYGFEKFYISTHYLPEIIKNYFGSGDKWGVDIEYVHEETPLGTGGALSLLPKGKITEPLLMINGDVLTKLNFEQLLQAHNESNSIATMCVREYEYKIPYGVVESNNGKIVGFIEKPTYHFQVNAGIYVVDPKLLSKLNHQEKIDMPTLLENNFSFGIHAAVFHDYWLDIGKMDDFEKAQQDVKDLNFV
ncbi:nucleotidyltransferase family protein [Shewanella pneumatophori]|uniref:Nucleotidyltransferase family protein n=1 Tax=Shewanella pneumatophori TaxID=314092 RepID=A0A9X2CF49_9GAMM|nr:nucleotidyltransferase family protein [Shewanella pneumatophori]